MGALRAKLAATITPNTTFRAQHSPANVRIHNLNPYLLNSESDMSNSFGVLMIQEKLEKKKWKSLLIRS